MSDRTETDTALATEREGTDSKIQGLNDQVTQLTKDLADAKKGSARSLFRVGGSNAVGGKNNPAPMEAQMGLKPPQTLDLFRCYDNGGPMAQWSSGSSFSQYFGKRPMWWSCKGDIDNWADPKGSNITNAKKLASTYDPKWPTLYWTIWHEVQPKLVDKTFTFAQFKKAWQCFYSNVRPLAPANVHLMVIHGGYAWRPATGNRPSGDETTIPSSQNPYCASPAEWRSLDVDLYGVDAYGGPKAEDIADMGRFKRFAKEMAGGDYTKVGIAESNFRQSTLTSTQDGVDWVHRNGDKLADLGTNAWCLWNSDKTVDPGPMKPEQVAAYGDVWRKYSEQAVGV